MPSKFDKPDGSVAGQNRPPTFLPANVTFGGVPSFRRFRPSVVSLKRQV
jgi:hypothetical protein